MTSSSSANGVSEVFARAFRKAENDHDKEPADFRTGFVSGYIEAGRDEVIRALEELVPELCWVCKANGPENNVVKVDDGSYFHPSRIPHGQGSRCPAWPLHARLAALRGER